MFYYCIVWYLLLKAVVYLYQKSEIKTVVFSSVQSKMLSMHSEKPIYAPPPSLRSYPNIALPCFLCMNLAIKPELPQLTAQWVLAPQCFFSYSRGIKTKSIVGPIDRTGIKNTYMADLFVC